MSEEFGRCRWVQLRRRKYVQCSDSAFSNNGLCLSHHQEWRERERSRILHETGVDPWSEPEEETKPLGFDVRGMGFGPQEKLRRRRWNPDESPKSVDTNDFPPHLFRELLFCRLQQRGINSNQIKKFYVTQFNYFWALKPVQWAEVIIDALTNPNGYQLDQYHILKGRPRDVHRDSGGSYYVIRDDIQIETPLDWEIPEWLHAAENLGLLAENEFISEY